MKCLRNDTNVGLCPRIDFEITRELTAESGHLDCLARTQAADVNARRRADKRMNFAGAVVDKDDETEGQIVDDGLRDGAGYRDELTFSSFTDAARRDRKWLHFRAATVSLNVGHVDENK